MFNKVILMGRLVADPELRQTPSNVSVCRFRIAVDRGYSSNSGEKQADFISVTAWRQSAEFVSKYFSKGKMIIVEGSLRNADYTDANGVKHYAMDVQAEKVTFGESKNAGAQAPSEMQHTTSESSNNSKDLPSELDDLSEFEEILSDVETPF